MKPPVGLTTRRCRNLLASSRVRRQAMAVSLNEQWRELRKYATIERDPQKLAKLVADWRNASRTDAVRKYDGT
jgi:hypothetical protein